MAAAATEQKPPPSAADFRFSPIVSSEPAGRRTGARFPRYYQREGPRHATLPLVECRPEALRVGELVWERLGGPALTGDRVEGGVMNDLVEPAREVLNLCA